MVDENSNKEFDAKFETCQSAIERLIGCFKDEGLNKPKPYGLPAHISYDVPKNLWENLKSFYIQKLAKAKVFMIDEEVQLAYRNILLDTISDWQGEHKNLLIHELDKVILGSQLCSKEKNWAFWFLDKIMPIFMQMDDIDEKYVKKFVYNFIMIDSKKYFNQ